MIDWESCRSSHDLEALADRCCRKSIDIEVLLDALFRLSPKHRVQQYAAYTLLKVHRRCPDMLDPHLSRLVNLLRLPSGERHVAIPRQVFAVLQDREIPEELAGEVFAKAVDTFLEKREPIAARARALDCCVNVAGQYEGLWEEVRELALSIDELESAGMQSVKRRALKQWSLRSDAG